MAETYLQMILNTAIQNFLTLNCKFLTIAFFNIADHIKMFQRKLLTLVRYLLVSGTLIFT